MCWLLGPIQRGSMLPAFNPGGLDPPSSCHAWGTPQHVGIESSPTGAEAAGGGPGAMSRRAGTAQAPCGPEAELDWEEQGSGKQEIRGCRSEGPGGDLGHRRVAGGVAESQARRRPGYHFTSGCREWQRREAQSPEPEAPRTPHREVKMLTGLVAQTRLAPTPLSTAAPDSPPSLFFLHSDAPRQRRPLRSPQIPRCLLPAPPETSQGSMAAGLGGQGLCPAHSPSVCVWARVWHTVGAQ